VAAGTELRLPITEKACYRKDREGDAKGAKKFNSPRRTRRRTK